MSYLSEIEIKNLNAQLITDPVELRKEYNLRKAEYMTYSCAYSKVDELIKEGWEEDRRYKTKVKLKKLKPHDQFFEDKLWCLFYDLGFRILNEGRHFKLKYGIESFEKQQIDVIAINDEIAFVVECKSSVTVQKYSYKKDFESISLKKDGFRKSIKDLVGERRLKYVFATENQIISQTDTERLKKERCFHVDDNSLTYMNQLLKHYKGASKYQILATFFRGERINRDDIVVPAIKGKMGGKTYYMFSIEPEHLLKVGFVSHRTRANSFDVPTYQRLIVPSRIKALNQFLDQEKGYFPNSVIINFNIEDFKLKWETGTKRNYNTDAENGVLHIPNVYALAYIIDGQHRIYGYADSIYRDKNTIPVVAFENLDSDEQLKMFLDINENQKAISKGLKLTLQEDVNWNSPILKNRIVALSSSIINKLGSNQEPLKSLLSVGEDRAIFSPDNFHRGFMKGGLLPTANKDKLTVKGGALYDLSNTNMSDEMSKTAHRVSKLTELLYFYLAYEKDIYFNEDHKLFYSNRANYAFIYLLGVINEHLSKNNMVGINTDPERRWEEIKPFFDKLFKQYDKVNKSELGRITSSLGQGAEGTYSMFMLSLINAEDQEFTTDELESWKETQDENLQKAAHEMLESIESTLKRIIFSHLQFLYDENYEYEIKENIVSNAKERKDKEERKIYADEKRSVKLNWEDFLNMINYYEIIKEKWGVSPPDDKDYKLKFLNIFAFDVESGPIQESGIQYFKYGKVSSKDKGTSWLPKINQFRNKVAHRATRATGLNKDEVQFIECCHNTISKVVKEYSL